MVGFGWNPNGVIRRNTIIHGDSPKAAHARSNKKCPEALATLLGAFISGGFAVAGAYFALGFQAKRAADVAFVNSIHEILIGMYPQPIDWPSDSWKVLQDRMPQMQLAVQKLRWHLSKKQVSRLDDTWTKYKNYCRQINDAGIPAHQLYTETTPSVDQKARFKAHVDILLSVVH